MPQDGVGRMDTADLKILLLINVLMNMQV